MARLLLTLVAVLVLAAPAQAGTFLIGTHADDAGSGVPSIGDPCYPPGARGEAYNPQKGRMVPALCQLGPGGTTAIWVDVEGNLKVAPVLDGWALGSWGDDGFAYRTGDEIGTNVEDAGGIGYCYPGEYREIATSYGRWVCHGVHPGYLHPETWGWTLYWY